MKSKALVILSSLVFRLFSVLEIAYLSCLLGLIGLINCLYVNVLPVYLTN
jgi:hypothetical protein